MTKKCLAILPTYNEKENVVKISREILRNDNCEILFIDDNSPDGTAEAVKKLGERDERIKIIVRPGKMGLGTAYVAGFRYAVERDYECVLMMDSDFSHPSERIPDLITSCADMAVGSRYVPGSGIEGWGLHRLFLSKYANIYARRMLDIPVHDLTGGFNRIKTRTLRTIDLDLLKEEGYAFLIELKSAVWKKGGTFSEIPIVFSERRAGKSKMSKKIIWDAFWLVLRLRMANRGSSARE